jgi:hypothetical protein
VIQLKMGAGVRFLQAFPRVNRHSF